MTRLLNPKRELLKSLIRDFHAQHTSPLHKFMQEWQDLADPHKYQLIAAAMGQKFKAAPIPNRTLRNWIKKGILHARTEESDLSQE